MEKATNEDILGLPIPPSEWRFPQCPYCRSKHGLDPFHVNLAGQRIEATCMDCDRAITMLYDTMETEECGSPECESTEFRSALWEGKGITVVCKTCNHENQWSIEFEGYEA